jgi:hypothetical protein
MATVSQTGTGQVSFMKLLSLASGIFCHFHLENKRLANGK